MRDRGIAIDYVVENCARRFYGASPLYPTGPVLFGRALAAALAERRQRDDADDQWIGRIDWPEHQLEVGVSRAEVKGAPPLDPAAQFSREYEERLHAHYRREGYWQDQLPPASRGATGSGGATSSRT